MLFGLQRAYRSVASALRYGGRHYQKHYRTKPADRPRNYEEAVLKASPAGRAAAAEAFRRSTARQKEALSSVPAPSEANPRTESVRFVVNGTYTYPRSKPPPFKGEIKASASRAPEPFDAAQNSAQPKNTGNPYQPAAANGQVPFAPSVPPKNHQRSTGSDRQHTTPEDGRNSQTQGRGGGAAASSNAAPDYVITE